MYKQYAECYTLYDCLRELHIQKQVMSGYSYDS